MIGIDAAIMMTYCSTLENPLASGANTQIRDPPCPNHQPCFSICHIISVTNKTRDRRNRLRNSHVESDVAARDLICATLMIVATIELQPVSFQGPSKKRSQIDADKIPRLITNSTPIFFRSFILSCHMNVAGNTARRKSVITLTADRNNKKVSQ